MLGCISGDACPWAPKGECHQLRISALLLKELILVSMDDLKLLWFRSSLSASGATQGRIVPRSTWEETSNMLRQPKQGQGCLMCEFGFYVFLQRPPA